MSGDTTVELSLALLHDINESDIDLGEDSFGEEMYRTYYHGGIRNRVSVTVGAIDNDDAPVLQLYASRIDEIKPAEGSRAFSFEGQRLEFANGDGDLLFALRFQHSRIGSLVFNDQGGSLRARVVL